LNEVHELKKAWSKAYCVWDDIEGLKKIMNKYIKLNAEIIELQCKENT